MESEDDPQSGTCRFCGGDIEGQGYAGEMFCSMNCKNRFLAEKKRGSR